MQWYGFSLMYVQPIAEMIAVTLVCHAFEQFLAHLENKICEMIISWWSFVNLKQFLWKQTETKLLSFDVFWLVLKIWNQT